MYICIYTYIYIYCMCVCVAVSVCLCVSVCVCVCVCVCVVCYGMLWLSGHRSGCAACRRKQGKKNAQDVALPLCV